MPCVLNFDRFKKLSAVLQNFTEFHFKYVFIEMFYDGI